MTEILRNLYRRKLRSALTISGIVIGIFALTTMGSLAEHFNSLLSVGVQYSSAAISVNAPSEQTSTLLPLSTAQRLRHVRGVAAVYPAYQVAAAPNSTAVQLGAPTMVTNELRGAAGYGMPATTLASGHDLQPGTRGEVVLGATFATTFKKRVGDGIRLPVRPSDAPPGFVNHPFTVVGILATTGSPFDSFAQVNDADARMLLADTLPPSIRSAVDVNELAQGFTVFAAKGTSLHGMDAIARRINATVPGVQAPLPSQSVQSFKSTSTTFTSVFTGAAILALVIGGLSVINTMIMAVSERTREIGLKKAVGAHTGQVMREYLLEAAMIGAIGGLAGFGLGLGLTSLIDAIGHQGGYDVFLVTPRLAAVALLFAVAMATAAGIAPAFRAARLDPVTALRSL